MKVIVFGATGSLGQHIVKNAIDHDHDHNHEITAFARHPDRLTLSGSQLKKVAGDVFDQQAVNAAIEGQDAVIIALGAGMKGRVRETGTRNVIEAMKCAGVSRLIVLSTLGAGNSRRYLNFFWKYLMFGILLRRAMVDHERQELIVRESGLDWTIVRPAAFTDEPATGCYKHGSMMDEGELALKLPRADVAEFMLSQLEHPQYLHQTPALSL